MIFPRLKLLLTLLILPGATGMLYAQYTPHHHGRRGNSGNDSLTTFAPPVKRNRPDTLLPCAAFSGSYAYQLPSGDLAKRFGANSNVGINASYKTGKNIFFTLGWSYIFGSDVRETGILDSISTSTGFVINKEGKYADIHIFERGWTLTASAGKIFNSFLSPNKNSGPLLILGAGYLQHKIKIYDVGQASPQLSGDYIKGYDRLTGGIAFSEFAGYIFMSKSRYFNFFGGFEFTEGITKSLRSWDFDLMRRDTRTRFDVLSGFRAGWIIPIYHSPSKDYFYD